MDEARGGCPGSAWPQAAGRVKVQDRARPREGADGVRGPQASAHLLRDRNKGREGGWWPGRGCLSGRGKGRHCGRGDYWNQLPPLLLTAPRSPHFPLTETGESASQCGWRRGSQGQGQHKWLRALEEQSPRSASRTVTYVARGGSRRCSGSSLAFPAPLGGGEKRGSDGQAGAGTGCRGSREPPGQLLAG